MRDSVFSGDFPKHAKISRDSTIIIKYVYGFSACGHRLINLVVEASRRYDRKCEIHFIASVVLAQQILAGLGKVAGKQSLVLWIHDVQKCTRAWCFEKKEYDNEENKQLQHEWKSAQYFPRLPLKIRCLTRFQFSVFISHVIKTKNRNRSIN